MVLHVGRRELGPGAGEEADKTGADGERTAALEHVLEPGAELPQRARHDVVDGDREAAFVADARLKMVLQILPDAGRVVLNCNPHRLEMLLRADAGEEEQLRRVDGAAGE